MSKKIKGILLLFALVLVAGSAFAAPVYPLKSNVTLTYWMPLHANVALIAKNFGDIEFAKELTKRTGVKVQYLHPAAGTNQAREAFNLMLASGDLPDIIEYSWFDIPGGPNSALDNGYILKLNPVIDKYSPNLKKFLKQNPTYNKMVQTDEGSYFVYPFVRADETLVITAGPMLRYDWLKELGLAVPETIDEWYNVLKAFKDKKGATAPLCLEAVQLSQTFAGGFDNTENFYQEKGKVKFGGIEPNRKKYFAEMNKWYNEGLLDKNFATINRRIIDSNVLTGKTGASYGSGGSGLGRYMQAMVGKEPKSFSLGPARFPTPKKGTLPKFANATLFAGPNNQGSAAISAKCKNVEAAARLLDYAYSPAGHLLYNFGIEGVSYKMVDKNPVYTELIMKNPEGLALTQVMSKYMRGHTNGPFAQDKRYLEQYYELPEQKEAIKVWSKQEWLKYMMPPVTPTPKESEELAKIMNDINTYTEEMTLKFIMGVEPLDKFDAYVAQIKKLGIDRATQIYQAALDRYNKRK